MSQKHAPNVPLPKHWKKQVLKAGHAWSLTQAAAAFLVTAETIASWTKRVDEAGEDGLVQTAEPANKFPDLVRTIVQRLKLLCPSMGKVKIAQTRALAGLHLGVTTVGRILKEEPQPTPEQATGAQRRTRRTRPSRLRRPTTRNEWSPPSTRVTSGTWT